MGRVASEEVVLQLVSSKCVPILLYGTEVCPLNNHDISSLDFVLNRFLMKLFKSTNKDFIDNCAFYFNFGLPSALVSIRRDKFVNKYDSSDNKLCRLCRTGGYI